MNELLGFAVLSAASFLAGAINSVAGGGSLLSFPALVAYGQPALIANATNTAIVWPGTLSSAYAYRREFPMDRGLVVPLAITSLAGGILGAAVLVRTPPLFFQKLTPFLVLFAASIFAARGLVARAVARYASMAGIDASGGRIAGFFFQFAVAFYGGYFGAGMGIMMLASFSLMRVGEIHSMNALKTVLATILNGIALLYFAAAGLINWKLAVTLGFCATVGGYVGARMARRLPAGKVHTAVVILGFAASAWLFYKNYA